MRTTGRNHGVVLEKDMEAMIQRVAEIMRVSFAEAMRVVLRAGLRYRTVPDQINGEDYPDFLADKAE